MARAAGPWPSAEPGAMEPGAMEPGALEPGALEPERFGIAPAGMPGYPAG